MVEQLAERRAAVRGGRDGLDRAPREDRPQGRPPLAATRYSDASPDGHCRSERRRAYARATEVVDGVQEPLAQPRARTRRCSVPADDRGDGRASARQDRAHRPPRARRTRYAELWAAVQQHGARAPGRGRRARATWSASTRRTPSSTRSRCTARSRRRDRHDAQPALPRARGRASARTTPARRSCSRSSALLPVVEEAKAHLPKLEHVHELEGAWDMAAGAERRSRAGRPSIPLKDIAVLPYSSGTTGLPKGVMLTHQNLTANIRQTMALGMTTESAVVLDFLPFYHIYGMMVLLNCGLAAGATQVDHAALRPGGGAGADREAPRHGPLRRAAGAAGAGQPAAARRVRPVVAALPHVRRGAAAAPRSGARRPRSSAAR